MLDVRDLQAQNLQALEPGVLARLAEQMRAQLQEQSQLITEQCASQAIEGRGKNEGEQFVAVYIVPK